MTGKAFEIHGGKSYFSPEEESEELALDRAFWRTMAEKQRRRHEALSLLRCVYHRVGPEKLSQVDKWGLDFEGKEEELLARVTKSVHDEDDDI